MELTERVAILEGNQKENERRFANLEEDVKAIGELTLSIERMTVVLESLVKKTDDTSERLTNLEKIPTEKWNSLNKLILTGVVSAIIGAIMQAILSNI